MEGTSVSRQPMKGTREGRQPCCSPRMTPRGEQVDTPQRSYSCGEPMGEQGKWARGKEQPRGAVMDWLQPPMCAKYILNMPKRWICCFSSLTELFTAPFVLYKPLSCRSKTNHSELSALLSFSGPLHQGLWFRHNSKRTGASSERAYMANL